MVETRRKPEDYGRNGHGHMRQNYIETDSEADLTIEEKRKQVESHPVWLEWKNRIHNIPDPKDTQSANFLSQSTRKFYNRLFARKEKNPFVNSLPPLDRKWKEDNVDPDILASFQSLYQDTLKSRHQIRDADKHFGGLIRKMTEDEIRDRLDAWSLVPSEEEKGKSMTLRQSYEAPREADWTGVSSTTSRAQREEQKAAMKKLRKQEEADAARHAARHADRTGKQYTKDTDMTLGTEESRSARTHSAEGSSVDQRKERPRGSEFDSTEVVPRPKHPRKHLPTESSTQDDRESMKNLDRRLRKPAQLKSSDPTDTTDRPKGLRSCLRPTPQQFKTYEPHKETESSEGSFISKSTDAAASSRKLDPRQIDPKRQLDPDESSKYLRKRVKPPSSTERQTVSASSASSEGDDTSSSTSLVPYRRDHNSSQDTLESGSSRGVQRTGRVTPKRPLWIVANPDNLRAAILLLLVLHATIASVRETLTPA